MKKLRCFILCLMLSLNAASGLLPFFHTMQNPPITVQGTNPYKDADEMD